MRGTKRSRGETDRQVKNILPSLSLCMCESRARVGAQGKNFNLSPLLSQAKSEKQQKRLRRQRAVNPVEEREGKTFMEVKSESREGERKRERERKKSRVAISEPGRRRRGSHDADDVTDVYCVVYAILAKAHSPLICDRVYCVYERVREEREKSERSSNCLFFMHFACVTTKKGKPVPEKRKESRGTRDDEQQD